MATRLQIAHAQARVAEARRSGTVLPDHVAQTAALDFAQADDAAPDMDPHVLADKVGPFYDPDGLEKWFRLSQQDLDTQEKDGDILGVRSSDGEALYPSFQFDSAGRPLPRLRELLEGIDPNRDDGWADALWLNTPARDLDGLTPAQALRTNRADEAIRLAQHVGGYLRR